MKIAVVYYSYDENCAFVAEQINACQNADITRLKMRDGKRRSGSAKFFWGGSMVMFKKKPPLESYNFDPSAYDLIILGSPVWAGSPAPPLRTFLSNTKIEGKKIALFVCHAGGPGNALKKFEAMLPGNEIVSQIDFQSPAKETPEDVKQRISGWIKSITE